MTEFAIYQINLSKPLMTDWTVEYDVPLEKAQEFFGKLFVKGVSLKQLSADSNSNSPNYRNTVIEAKDDIVVWRIHNEQSKDIVKPAETTTNGIQDYESVQELSYPHSLVIIDNRPGILFMAIEKSSAWRSNINKVRNIVMGGLKNNLKKYNLDISIIEQTVPTKIWDFCKMQCKDGRDHITNISIDIKNPNRIAPQRSNDDNLPDIIKYMQERVIMSDAVNAVFGLNYCNGDPEEIQNTVDDMVEVVRTCIQNKYTLTVTFAKYGVYKCDEQVVAIFPMPEGYIYNFSSSWDDIFVNNLISGWFDECYIKIEEYRNATKAPKQTNRNNQK